MNVFDDINLSHKTGSEFENEYKYECVNTDDIEKKGDTADLNANAEEPKQKPNVRKDRNKIALLMFLYFMQGVPLGLSMAIPLILSSRRVSYNDQGKFSFAIWPYSIKLLWAPIVDSVFISRIGRRKTWLIPTQYLIGIFMFSFADMVQTVLDDRRSDEPTVGVGSLAAIFFVFNLLATIQDVAVDGWALTLLSPENVSWASTSNSVGQTAGWFIGNSFFLIFESAEFSNYFIRSVFGLPHQDYGLVNVKRFMLFFGVFYTVSTTLVLFFVKEKQESHVKSKNFPIAYTYNLILKIIKLKPMKRLMLLFLTIRIGLGAEGISTLKLIEAGVPRDRIGILYIPLLPLLVILPLTISKYTNGPRPLTFFLNSLKLKYIGLILVALFVYFTPVFKDENDKYPFSYYMIFLLISAYNGIFQFSCSIAQGAFFNRISDANVGGTYMTFINTVSNLGGIWPATASLFVLNYITFKDCSYPTTVSNTIHSANLTDLIKNATTPILQQKYCSGKEEKVCELNGGKCVTYFEGFYVLIGLGVAIGLIWFIALRKKFTRLQDVKKNDWNVCKYSIGLNTAHPQPN